LANRMLAITSAQPIESDFQFIDILINDQQLPSDIRLAIAQALPQAGASRSVTAKYSADKHRKTESTSPRPSRTAKVTRLLILLGIMRDATARPTQRRKAASEVAKRFLPSKPGEQRWWVNAPVDEYGFAITPQIAAEYRDTRLKLRQLLRSRTNSPAAARTAARMEARLQAILHRLQSPCPSRYGLKQLAADRNRLLAYSHQRDSKLLLNQSRNADEAHRRARVDSIIKGPEGMAQQRLFDLKDKERIYRNAAGPPLTQKEQADLRVLRLLYPQSASRRSTVDELEYWPLRDAPLAADGNLYPVDSKLRPLVEGEIIEEFVDVPPYVYGNPNRPGHRWSWEPPT
jgi:hypothetical protein